MTTWTNITTAALEPGKPVRSVDGLALRDNPIAIAEGAAGAPKVEDAALDGTATSAGTDWVLDRNASAAAGAVGTYAFMLTSGGPRSAGDTIAGSSLSYASMRYDIPSLGDAPSMDLTTDGTPSGTWRLMGGSGSGPTSNNDISVWLRIS